MEDLLRMLATAASLGHLNEIKDILINHPELDINWRNEEAAGRTVLHEACAAGEMVIAAVLLVHPEIIVNQKDNFGQTPFLLACGNGHYSVVRWMLKDARVDINEPSNSGRSPWREAAHHGHHMVVQEIMARGWDLEEIARPEELAAEVFAMLVFLCDGLLDMKNSENNGTESEFEEGDEGNENDCRRFFRIAQQLPMELQMLLCHRLNGSMKNNIPGRDSEQAFKNLARELL